MADITVKVKGLTGTLFDITIDNGLTWSDLRTAVVAVEGGNITTSMHGQQSLVRDLSINSSGGSTTTFAANGIVTGDEIICRPRRNADKETLADQKNYIAEAKRQGLAAGDTAATYYRNANVYDKTLVPNPYEGNDYNVDDDENTGALVPKRPWDVGSIAAPLSIEDAVQGESIADLQIWYDAADTATIKPNAMDEGQITQWTDKSRFAHNANPDGGSAKPTYEDTDTSNTNGYGYIEFDGVDDRLTINPFTQLAGATGWTMFVVAQKTDGAELTGVLTRTDYGDLRIELAATGSGVTVTTAGQTVVYANQSDTNWNAWTLVYEASQPAVFRKNGGTLTPGSSPNQDATLNASNNEMYIGGSASDVWPGNIAEVIMFSRTLTPTEYANVENYLTTKWGI